MDDQTKDSKKSPIYLFWLLIARICFSKTYSQLPILLVYLFWTFTLYASSIFYASNLEPYLISLLFNTQLENHQGKLVVQKIVPPNFVFLISSALCIVVIFEYLGACGSSKRFVFHTFWINIKCDKMNMTFKRLTGYKWVMIKKHFQ
jgi:hypothetical protein